MSILFRTDKFQFVALTISYTITPSRTRLPHLVHDYPYLAHDYSHLVHDYPHLAHDFKIGRDGLFVANGRKLTG